MTPAVPSAPGAARTGLRSTVVVLALSTVARTVLGALVLAVLVAVVPTAAGWQAVVVSSGSMAPSVQPGDVTLARPVDTVDLAPGQVLLVDAPDTAGGLLLHRLVSAEDGGLRLRGDANPTADGPLVDPAAVHGVATLRLPGLGLPVLWAAQGRWPGLGATAFGLAGLLGLAVLHRSPTGDGPVTSVRRRARRVSLGTAVLAVAALLPATAGAAFSATTVNGPDTFGSTRYYTCAAGSANAVQYLPLQESAGPVADNVSPVYAENGTYAGGVTYGVPGPACNSASRAVRLDGTSGFVHSAVGVTLQPTTSFSTQLWFSTSTTQGGHLIGFGNGTDGAASSARDRLVYMTDAGNLAFGVYDGTARTITSPARYNDGKWHLVTATFSSGAGTRLFVDGTLVAQNGTYTAAQETTGHFRAGYDDLQGWPGEPTSDWFAGSIAHMSVFNAPLPDTVVADQFRAAN